MIPDRPPAPQAASGRPQSQAQAQAQSQAQSQTDAGGSAAAAAAAIASSEAAGDKAYWAALARMGDHAPRAGSAMKRRKDWDSIADSQGRTPMMWVAAMDGPASWHVFAGVKKAKEGLARKDAQGRSLWAYAMARGAHLDPDDFEWLLGSVEPSVDYFGRGLVGQALSVFWRNSDPRGLIESSLVPREWSQGEALGVNAALIDALQDPKIWWGASTEAQDELAGWIVKDIDWGSGRDWSPPRLAQMIWCVANESPVDGLSPKLLGAIALVQAAAPEGFSICCQEKTKPASEDGMPEATYGWLGGRLGFGGGGTSEEIAKKKRAGDLRPLRAGGALPPRREIPDGLAERVWPARQRTGFGPRPWMPEWEALGEANAQRAEMAQAIREDEARRAKREGREGKASPEMAVRKAPRL